MTDRFQCVQWKIMMSLGGLDNLKMRQNMCKWMITKRVKTDELELMLVLAPSFPIYKQISLFHPPFALHQLHHSHQQHQWHQHQRLVSHYTANMVIGNYDEIPDVDGDHFICLTCKNYLKKEKLPPMAHCNKLEMFKISNDYESLNLTELEQCVIARQGQKVRSFFW